MKGDGVTGYRSVNLSGTAGPNQSVQVYGTRGIGLAGALSDAGGRWSATTPRLAAGTYTLTAVTFDSAGNRSAPSPATRLTILGRRS